MDEPVCEDFGVVARQRYIVQRVLQLTYFRLVNDANLATTPKSS